VSSIPSREGGRCRSRERGQQLRVELVTARVWIDWIALCWTYVSSRTWVVFCLFFVTRILRVGVQIFSLSVWVVHHQITYFCLFFFSPEPKSHTFFPQHPHSDKCSKTVLLNFLLSTPTVLGTISTPTTVNLTINSAREQLSSSQR